MMLNYDGRDIAKLFTALLTSLLLVAIATSFVLPNRPSPQVIKAFFTGLSGAIASVVGQTAANPGALVNNPAIGVPLPGNVSSLSVLPQQKRLPVPNQYTPNQYVTGYRGIQ